MKYGFGNEDEIGRDRVSTQRRKGLERAFQTAKQKQVGAIITTAESLHFRRNKKRFFELGGKYRLPAIYQQKVFVDEGILMSYGSGQRSD